MSTYELGTVADATVRGVPNVRVFRLREGTWVTGQDVSSTRVHHDERVTDVRPLVTLDLYNEPTTQDVCRVLREDGYGNVADQIEAQTKPPKPDEPLGLGAVVEDSHGEKYVQVEPLGGVWRCARTADAFTWDAIPAVRILSDGWVSQP